MTSTSAGSSDTVDAPVTPLPASTRRAIYAYLGGLMVLTSFSDPNGSFLDVPFSFVLKNALGLQAHELSTFRLVAGIPLYASVLFGLARDNWSPFGRGDRGLVLVFGVASIAIFGVAALLPVSLGTLLAASLALTTASLFIAAAQNGLAASIGRQHAMTGRISATWNVFTSLPSTLLFVGSGYLSQSLSGAGPDTAAPVLFSVGALASLFVVLFVSWRPSAVFDNVQAEHTPRTRLREDLRRLLRHKPLRPALLIWLLWNFAPGSVTPLQYHLQNALGAADWQWGTWNAVFAASFLPTYILFGVLCQRVTLRRLLFWGTLVAVPQFTPLLVVNSIGAATAAAVPAGLLGGLATAAYVDLIMRSAPPGLQGTTLMAASSMYFVATRFGDVLGSVLYDATGGFGACVAATTLSYLCILLVLRWVPDALVNTTDGTPAA